jgi:deoxycytidylate deaminase
MDSKSHEYFFNQAVKIAMSALCLRDKCGAIIVKDGIIISSGYNAPPLDDPESSKCTCDFPTSTKPKSDRTCCVHAEWRAIMDTLKNNKDLNGSILYFTRVDDSGTILYSGEPYCTVCSRLALDVGISQWALWHDNGIKLYDTKSYNDLSYQFHGK